VRIACVLLALTLASVCFGQGEDLVKQLQELKSQVSALQAQIQELESKLREQEAKLETQEETIAEIREQPQVQLPDGLEISAGITGVLQGTSNADDVSPEGDVWDGSYSVDLSLGLPVGDSGKFFVSFEAGEGEGVVDELSLLSGVNCDAVGGDGAARVAEAWYEHYLADGKLTFTVGKLDPTVYFDTNAYANDETTQFLADMFVNNPAFACPGYTPGVRFAIKPSELFEINLGYFDADEDWENIFDEEFGVAEIAFYPVIAGRQGGYRLYYWYRDEELAKWDGGTEEAEGFGVSFDQEITDKVGVFARLGWQDEDLYESDFSWSAGLQASSLIPGRENDTLGFAMGSLHLSDEWENSGSAPEDTGDEMHFELYYNIFVNEYVAFTPDIQYIINPTGDDEADSITVFGTRLQVGF